MSAACPHCEPTITKACGQCAGTGADCWLCDGEGWVETTFNDPDPLLIVHNGTECWRFLEKADA